MNYFAHGIRFLNRPVFLAGTAVPDWLSVADRKVRLREKHVRPAFETDDALDSELAAGILQHQSDDDWFHRSRAFYEVTSDVADLFRAHLGAEDGFRPGFLGHIATELLLDRLLIEAHPGTLERYYRALDELDPRAIQQAVNRVAPRTTERLAAFVEIFRQVRFLFDYLEPERMLLRLNQVLRRVKLNPLPASVSGVLEAAFDVLRVRGRELLPPEYFLLENSTSPISSQKESP